MNLLLSQAHRRLAQHDTSLWGESAESVARVRLGWIDLPESSREFLPALDALAAWARSRELTRVVLSGMGGSSLAPEVIAARYHRDLILLDSTHPGDVKNALEPDPTHTVFVISSKSGETIETISHLAATVHRLEQAHLEVEHHLVIISDPGSPLERWAKARNVRFFAGNPEVGGRFSALSIFGLLPSALLGIDVTELLDDAADMKARITAPFERAGDERGGENLTIALVEEVLTTKPFLRLPADPLSDWIEQLVAESTGKQGVGIIPCIIDEGESYPEKTATRAISAAVAATFHIPLGASFYLWEWSVALLCFQLGVNPFDQPNVTSAKEATKKALTTDGFANQREILGVPEAIHAIDQLLTLSKDMPERYLAILSFTPLHNTNARELIKNFQANLAAKYQTNVTLGFGPRYLHSTGQSHKGGPNIGLFIVLTITGEDDYPIAGAPYSFGDLLGAQSQGDLNALHEAGRTVLQLQMTWSDLERVNQSLRGVS